MTGEEMERAIDFLLRSQANLETRIEQVNENLGTKIEGLAARVEGLAESVAALTSVVRMQADSQGQFNQTLTTAVTALAEAQAKNEAKVDRLADVVGRLVERLAGGQG